jgi:hypothetical protein
VWLHDIVQDTSPEGAFDLVHARLVLITEQEFDKDMLRLDDPDFLMPSPILWTVCGRRAK